MYCRHCGKQVIDGSKFCTFCGGALGMDAGTPVPPADYRPSGYTQPSGYMHPPADYRPSGYMQPSSDDVQPPAEENQEPEQAPSGGLFFSGAGKHPQDTPHYLSNDDEEVFDDDDEDHDDRDDVDDDEEDDDDDVYEKPGRRSVLGPLLILIVLIAVMTSAGILGWRWLKAQQVRQAEVDVFQTRVDAFSEYLDDPTYSSQESKIRDLLSDCERAIKAKDTDQFAALEKRMERLVGDLSDVSVEVSTLEELEETYTSIIEKRYSISYDMRGRVDDALAELSEAVENGEVRKKDTLQKMLDELLADLEADNRKTIQEALDAVAELDLSGIDENRWNSLTALSSEVESLLNKGDFKGAVTTAEQYKSDATQYARELAVARSESIAAQQRRESEAARRAAEEEARKQSEAEAKRQSEEEARKESEEEARKQSEAEAKRESEEEARRQSEAEARRQSDESRRGDSDDGGQSDGNSGGSTPAPSNRTGQDYICPGSNSRYLTDEDLTGLSSWELVLARNEIYARHGRRFIDESIQAYFNSKSWYRGTVDPVDFDTSVFNNYELRNIEFIIAYESS